MSYFHSLSFQWSLKMLGLRSNNLLWLSLVSREMERWWYLLPQVRAHLWSSIALMHSGLSGPTGILWSNSGTFNIGFKFSRWWRNRERRCTAGWEREGWGCFTTGGGPGCLPSSFTAAFASQSCCWACNLGSYDSLTIWGQSSFTSDAHRIWDSILAEWILCHAVTTLILGV